MSSQKGGALCRALKNDEVKMKTQPSKKNTASISQDNFSFDSLLSSHCVSPPEKKNHLKRFSNRKFASNSTTPL